MLSTEEESTIESCAISDTERIINLSSTIIIDEQTQSTGISQEQSLSLSVSSSTPNKKRNNSFNKIKREQMRSRIKNSLFSSSKNTSLTCVSTDNLSDATANSIHTPPNEQQLLKLQQQSSNEKIPSLAISTESLLSAAPATMPELSKLQGQSPSKKQTVFMRFNSFENPEELEKERQQGIYQISGNFHEFYELQETLGEGCVGLVKKAVRKSDKQVFAVKTVRTRDEETIQNIKFEFTHLKQLNHKNIVKVYELYVDKLSGKIHSVMELIEGKEMFEVIHALGHYSEFIASKIFMQILDAIAYMHSHYCCHRDLKPNNILCNSDGTQVKITDFNVSKFSDHYKNYQQDDNNENNTNPPRQPIKMWTYTGTMAFSAPEVFNGEMYDETIDMWSAGCILFTMLSGTEPFHAEYVNDLVLSICKGQYDFSDPVWNEVSAEAKDLISKCLTVDPAARIHPQEALKHPFITRCRRLSCENKCKEQQQQQQSQQGESQQPQQLTVCVECDKESNLCRRQLGNNIDRLVANNGSRKSNPSRPRAVSSIFLQHGKFESQDKLFALLEQCCLKSKEKNGNNSNNPKSPMKRKQGINENNNNNINSALKDQQNQYDTKDTLDNSMKKRQRKYEVIFANQDCFQLEKETNGQSPGKRKYSSSNNNNNNNNNEFDIDDDGETSSEEDEVCDNQTNCQSPHKNKTPSRNGILGAEAYWSDAEGSLYVNGQQEQQTINNSNISHVSNVINPSKSFKKRLVFSNYPPLAYQEDLLQQQQRSFSCDLQSSEDIIQLKSELFNDILKLKQLQINQEQINNNSLNINITTTDVVNSTMITTAGINNDNNVTSINNNNIN